MTHVKNIEEPITKTIEQQQHSHGTEEDTSLSRDALTKKTRSRQVRSRGCVHHMSRVVTKRAAQDISQRADIIRTVMQVHEADSRTYAEAMRSPRAAE